MEHQQGTSCDFLADPGHCRVNKRLYDSRVAGEREREPNDASVKISIVDIH